MGMNENNEVRYYFNIEPDTGCNSNSNDSDYGSNCSDSGSSAVEILCVKCALRYKCSKCSTQSLTNCEIIDECIVCKAVFCELCTEPNFGNYMVCDKCINDDTITEEYILSLVENCKYEESESSSSNAWQHWEFGEFNFLSFLVLFNSYLCIYKYYL
eukprot:TRINITY_DN562_c0_g1_i1.p1 TRINITY_DN562_c0_g1~~TRINITY_DN562_c0_g1_i1.p1  ORF type:complete len:174 (-),score=49.94 TRINITY_DN562_c0_g1_i1:10-480(-)